MLRARRYQFVWCQKRLFTAEEKDALPTGYGITQSSEWSRGLNRSKLKISFQILAQEESELNQCTQWYFA